MADKQTNLSPLACVILAAGQGTRMKSELPKVMHGIAGMPMIAHVVAACKALSPEKIVVVVAPGMEQVEKAATPARTAIQQKALGTGDAVKAAKAELKDFKGDVIVLFGDAPLVTPEALKDLQKKRQETNAAIVVAGFTPDDASAYGRLVVDAKGNLSGIVENADATPEQKKIKLCNGGIMLFAGEKLLPLLDKLKDNNSKKEFYLTDCIALAKAAGDTCAVAEMPADVVLGVNSRVELAEAEKLMQQRLRKKAMLNGATLTDPETTFLSADTKLGRDVIIGPNV
ncbi:MAG TPA: NTP transferase domain-containing protein, partial [Alphaproteobacteria bacterium]|nr:NTP transferase domain-containing protein [Alphaproteobacteria bacterium]